MSFQSHCRSGQMKLSFEALETRRVLAGFLVTSAADAGAGSSREAVGLANGLAGMDTIEFDLDGAAVIQFDQR